MKNIKEKIIPVLNQILSKEFWKGFVEGVLLFVSFFGLLMLFLVRKVFEVLAKTPLKILVNKIMAVMDKGSAFLDKNGGGTTVKRSYLIELAFNNMKLKKTRSLMTVVGMAVGIGSIVFLVSLGFGLEKLVISRVARLEELKVADVSPGESVKLKLNQEVMDKISGIDGVKESVPVISVVGRVQYKEAVTDMLSYAVPRRYMNFLESQTEAGKLFENDEISFDYSVGEVAGVTTDWQEAVWGEEISGAEIKWNTVPEQELMLWSEPSTNSQMLGFVGRIEGDYRGREYWGDEFLAKNDWTEEKFRDSRKGVFLGKWIKTQVKLYHRDVDEKLVPVLDGLGRGVWQWGYVRWDQVQIIGEVLGETTSGDADVASSSAVMASEASATAVLFETVVASDSAGVEWVELKSATDSAKVEDGIVSFSSRPVGQAVISSAMARMFGMTSKSAIGQKFKLSFIVVKAIKPEIESKMMSEETEYEIVGVVTDENNPYVFVPFVDMLKLGASNFSQLRVVAKKQDNLPTIRKEIETMGFRTSSTVDTVAEIEKLFGNIRVLLGFLGLVALGVAVLGMFNTLTVSLLERTREIGGMKAMGMLSAEVRDLLLAEAMIMGFSGGLLGLMFGFGAGKILSLVLTLFSVVKGSGVINLSSIPIYFVTFILVMSFLVGVITGLYPARRATKISALNALRYE